MKRIMIVGAGITGLSTAYQLQKLGAGALNLRILEASDIPGGNIQTDRFEGCLIEKGPNGYLDNVEATRRLIDEIGLSSKVQRADSRAERRYLYRGGRLHLLPSSPVAFFRSPLLSVKARARVAMEPFSRKAPSEIDESVFDFASRRIGREAASILVDAMVSGVFAGNVFKLSLASTFPKMAAMEREHGGLVRAMISRMFNARREGSHVSGGGPTGPGGTLSSFKGGLDVLPQRLAELLGPALRKSCPVTSIRRKGTAWHVDTKIGESFEADAVFLSLPARRAALMIEDVSAESAAILDSIPTAGLAVVALAFRQSEVRDLPTGFGFLAPRQEGLRILGCLWDSCIFPDRAPEDTRLMRVMIGGAHDSEAVTLANEQLEKIVRSDLKTAMGIRATPQFLRIYRYPLGIAQYEIGHEKKLRLLESQLNELHGLFIGGSSYDGISMNACIEHSAEYALKILEYLQDS